MAGLVSDDWIAGANANGNVKRRPQNSASRNVEARNLPRFWYAFGSAGGTCHQSLRLMRASNLSLLSLPWRRTQKKADGPAPPLATILQRKDGEAGCGNQDSLHMAVPILAPASRFREREHALRLVRAAGASRPLQE